MGSGGGECAAWGADAHLLGDVLGNKVVATGIDRLPPGESTYMHVTRMTL